MLLESLSYTLYSVTRLRLFKTRRTRDREKAARVRSPLPLPATPTLIRHIAAGLMPEGFHAIGTKGRFPPKSDNAEVKQCFHTVCKIFANRESAVLF